MSNLKLGVEVVSAHNLLAKDGKGSSSTFVELHFDHQIFRTTTKENDLDPHWYETFYFQISDPSILSNLSLDAYIYNNISASQSKAFLGKVKISGTSFVPYSDAVVMYFPLEKRNIFSRVKGQLGLKVFITDNRYIKSSNALPSTDFMNKQKSTYWSQNQEYDEQIPTFIPTTVSEKREKDARRTFNLFPNRNYTQQPKNTEPIRYRAGEMRPEPRPPKHVYTYSESSSERAEFSLRETNPFLGGGQVVSGRVIPAYRPASTYDLVEPMHYLFVRIVKARGLPSMDVTGSLDPYVEVKIGNYKGVTKHLEKNQKPEYNTVFAFSKNNIQSSVLDVVIKDKDMLKDDFVGVVRFDLNEVPTRVPPDSPLAPEWYRLKDKNGEQKRGEIMVSVWMGTQADEAFPDAWHSDAASGSDGNPYIRAKAYHSPRLWYLRVGVIEAQDLVLSEKHHFPNVYVKAQIGSQVVRTKPVQSTTMNALWNEELVLVAAEPLDEHLVLMVEDRLETNKEETLGKVIIPLSSIEKRADDRIVNSRWFDLRKPSFDDVAGREKENDKFASRLRISVFLEGGYHVLDESTQYSSDLRPTDKQLWKKSIGFLELGILDADGIGPTKSRDGRGTLDTYCVAKYGQKWVRTRTIVNSLNPKYNEQYTWQVHDMATVLTVGVFDNCHVGEKGANGNNRDTKIGKIRIRISTLETGRVYTHMYPLLVLHPSGVKKMGELHLAIRFSCTSFVNMMYTYSRPLLPKMHYVRPFTMIQLDMLRYEALNIVAARLSRAEPPLRKEVIEYMSDAHSHLFSMRRSKANFFRLIAVFNGLFSIGKWFVEICKWTNPVTTVLVHVLFAMLVYFPELILPTGFLYMFFLGLWNFRFRPKYPPHMNTKISNADSVFPDELDEEFDTFPTSKGAPEVIRMRYDRLRSVASKVQIVVGDVATQVERVQALLSWRDPRATMIFLVFCFVSSLVLYVTPFQVFAVIAGFYAMRHPRLRHKSPAGPINFFRRLTPRTDCML